MSITNMGIARYVRKLDIVGFNGAISKDLLPYPVPPGFWVINMQDSLVHGHPGQGTHWALLSVELNRSVWIDSFGAYPPPVIVKKAPAPLYYSTKQIQDKDSDLCGYYTLYFMAQRSRGRSWQSIVDDFQTFPNTGGNYRIIDDFFGIHAR